MRIYLIALRLHSDIASHSTAAFNVINVEIATAYHLYLSLNGFLFLAANEFNSIENKVFENAIATRYPLWKVTYGSLTLSLLADQKKKNKYSLCNLLM